MSVSHTYNPVSGAYVSSAEDFGFTPANATRADLPSRPWGQTWPVWTGEAWTLVVDHRERKTPAFAEEDVQPATDYWLPGDTWETPARHIFVPGPLPKGAILSRPEKPVGVALAEARAAKTAEVETGYQSAVAATLTMPEAAPTAQDVAVGAALLAADDLEFIIGRHAATRATLLAQVEAADTAEAVTAIEVRYDV